MKRLHRPHGQQGAALLTAMLTVALVASLAGAALWRQWRVVEVEAGERARLQAQWLLSGALDWGRLILAEDARQGGADHLGEPWAVPLQEARLSSFLATDKTERSDAPLLNAAFLAGRIEDQQGRLNLRNLIDGRELSPADLSAFARLFDLLGLPADELRRLALGLRDALQPLGTEGVEAAPLQPQRLEHLPWVGLSEASLQKLRPFITLLPERTPLNLNTAPAEVLAASADGLDLAQARRLVTTRQAQPWRSVEEANRSVSGRPLFRSGVHGVSSRYFIVQGQLRQESGQHGHVLQAQALVRREGLVTRILWRDLRPVDAPSQAASR